MKARRAMALLPGLLLAPVLALADTPRERVQSVQRAALTSGHAFGFVQSLCDEVGPRLAGSPGDRAAVAWALRTMRGLSLADAHAEPVKVPHWVRGEASAEIVGGPVALPLVVAALGGSVGTPAAGLEADVLEVAGVAELAKLEAAAVRGKIVFLDPTMRRARDGSGYGEAVSSRTRGARLAAERGAVAMLLRSIGTDHDRVAHTGAKSHDDHEIPAAALSVPDAAMLHRVLAGRGTARVRLMLGAHLLPDAGSANVIGDVKGREKPQEIVLVGAHLDSWDQGTGAIDDGAGVAIALETARLIAAQSPPPRRTVRVVLFANEEHGLDGAKEYARAHAAEVAGHVVAMEADFGGDAVYAIGWHGDPARRDRFVDLARALAPLGIAREDAIARPGADVTPLEELGVPCLELRQDGTRYFDIHHTSNDTLDKIDPPSLAAAAAAFATAAWTAADLEGDLGRIPEAERKSAP